MDKDLYDSIGKWIADKKECHQEFSQGYLKDVGIEEGLRLDVFAIRYEIVHNVYPYFKFHGYVVEIKSDKNGISELIGKAERCLESKERLIGLSSIELYIAFPFEQIDDTTYKICKRDGIGILRLQIAEDGTVFIYEILKPKTVELQGISASAQRSPGNFEKAMKNVNFLKLMYQRPDDLYDNFIRPAVEAYKNELEGYIHHINYIKNNESKEALEFLLKEIKENFPTIKDTDFFSGVKIGNVHSSSSVELLRFNTLQQYFTVSVRGEVRYRVYSKTKVLNFSDSTLLKGGVTELLESVLLPLLSSEYKIPD